MASKKVKVESVDGAILFVAKDIALSKTKKVESVMFFDQALKTGWAVCIDPKRMSVPAAPCVKIWAGFVASGVNEIKSKRGESPAMRFHHFSVWVDKMLMQYKPDICGYEMPHFRGGYATELCVGFATRIQEACAKLSIDCTSIHSSTLKKHITGSGKSSKQEVIAAVAKKYPEIAIIDDNHADALAGLTKLVDDFLVPF